MKRSTTRALAASAFTAGAIFTTGAALLPAPLFYPSATMAVICAIVAVVVLVMGELRAQDSRAPAHDDPLGEVTTADMCRVLGVDIPPPRYDPETVAFARRAALLAEVDHAPFIVAANLSTPHAPHELEHLIELGLIGDPGETGALVTTDAGKATVKARR